jgi:hypothetical protein
MWNNMTSKTGDLKLSKLSKLSQNYSINGTDFETHHGINETIYSICR